MKTQRLSRLVTAAVFVVTAFSTLLTANPAMARKNLEDKINACIAKGCGTWCVKLPFLGFDCYCLCESENAQKNSGFDVEENYEVEGADVETPVR